MNQFTQIWILKNEKEKIKHLYMYFAMYLHHV